MVLLVGVNRIPLFTPDVPSRVTEGTTEAIELENRKDPTLNIPAREPGDAAKKSTSRFAMMVITTKGGLDVTILPTLLTSLPGLVEPPERTNAGDRV